MQHICAICGAHARSLGKVDFQKSCADEEGKSIAPSGIQIEYHRCSLCGFIFTPDFDQWSPIDFKQRIYNEDYVLFDPDYVEFRPKANAANLNHLFQLHRQFLSFLDYGGGNGRLAGLMREMGFVAETFDPFSEHHRVPKAKANVVTAFEVIEHSPRQGETLDEIATYLDPEGVLIFSTVLQPPDIEQVGLNWWYVAPRNGHVSLHSHQSLELLFTSRHMSVRHLSDNVHFAYRSEQSPLAKYLNEIGDRKRA